MGVDEEGWPSADWCGGDVRTGMVLWDLLCFWSPSRERGNSVHHGVSIQCWKSFSLFETNEHACVMFKYFLLTNSFTMSKSKLDFLLALAPSLFFPLYCCYSSCPVQILVKKSKLLLASSVKMSREWWFGLSRASVLGSAWAFAGANHMASQSFIFDKVSSDIIFWC